MKTRCDISHMFAVGILACGMSIGSSTMVNGCITLIEADKDDVAYNAILLARSDSSLGSAFAIRDKGVNWVVSAEHCARGGMFRCRDVNGRKSELLYSAFEVASNADICRLPLLIKNETLGGPVNFLTLATREPKVGDKVRFYGNAHGEDTICKGEGVIVSIGPERLEVEGDWCNGFSGGPVVAEYGVVGVIAYTTKKEKPNDFEALESLYLKNRHFAYRLDTAKWTKIDYEAYLRIVRGTPDRPLEKD